MALGPLADPRDYIFLPLGTQWNYSIKVAPKVQPLRFWTTRWQVGSGLNLESARGRFKGRTQNPGQHAFDLKLRLEGPAPVAGPLGLSTVVKIAVEEDSLGVFEGASAVFFATDRQFARQESMRIVEYPASESLAFMGKALTPNLFGHSLALVFFQGEPGTTTGLDDSKGIDVLQYCGEDTPPSSRDGQRCQHFLRNVTAGSSAGATSELNVPFSEDTWFARGVGLVRLEQRVNGAQTMTWTLES
jgi:hypothetical protein